jgi:hypothetical protein
LYLYNDYSDEKLKNLKFEASELLKEVQKEYYEQEPESAFYEETSSISEKMK